MTKRRPGHANASGVQHFRNVAEGLHTGDKGIRLETNVVVKNIGLVDGAQGTFMAHGSACVAFGVLRHGEPADFSVIQGTFIDYPCEGDPDAAGSPISTPASTAAADVTAICLSGSGGG